MSFNRPTIGELVERITADLETALGLANAALRNSFVKLFGKVIAGAAHVLHGHLDWVAKQVLPSTADDENLLRWASVFGIDRNAAQYAEGSATFTGENGSTIPEGTELTTADGVLFRTTEAGEISGGSVEIPVIASVPGEDGNTEEGTMLSLSAPVSGVDPEAEVTEELTGGSDQETIEELRVRVLARIQEPPLGGAQQDYEKWAKEVPGVTRAWAYPAYLGGGTVGVFFMRDNDDDPYPSEEEIIDVSNYIEERRPVTSRSYVFSPSAYPIDFELEVSPDTTEVRAAVQAELEDLLARDAYPGGPIYLSRIREAVSVAAGEIDNRVIQPSADVEPGNGFIATLGDITW